VRNGQRAAGQKIILKIDDDQHFHSWKLSRNRGNCRASVSDADSSSRRFTETSYNSFARAIKVDRNSCNDRSRPIL
jgi:hypothetical protein